MGFKVTYQEATNKDHIFHPTGFGLEWDTHAVVLEPHAATWLSFPQ